MTAEGGIGAERRRGLFPPIWAAPHDTQGRSILANLLIVLMSTCAIIPGFYVFLHQNARHPSAPVTTYQHKARDLAPRDSSPSVATLTTSAAGSASPAIATPLRVFQVDTPVLAPNGVINDGDNDTTLAATTAESSCSVTLMEFSFGDSFGKPFVGMAISPHIS